VPISLTIDELVAALRISRAAFGDLYLQAQAMFGVPGPARKQFEAVGLAADDREAYRNALTVARANGWLDPLLDFIVAQGLEDGHLAQAFAEDASRKPGNAALQAMTNEAAGFANPHVNWRGHADGMRWTCKILVDGVAAGTGVLIGPHLVLTAWHVVKRLFTLTTGQGWVPDSSAAPRLQVEFDDFLAMVEREGPLRPTRTQVVGVHLEWCVAYSACHEDELGDSLPADLTKLEAVWDYAVLRLVNAPGLKRGFVRLDRRSVVPRPNEPVLVFQHPAGQPMKMREDAIAAEDPATKGAVPRLRFVHLANALPGSSGGPCFDKTFTLFGVHQGRWNVATGNGKVANRGVPVARIDEHIEQTGFLPDLDPDENPLWNLGVANNLLPVIGCEEFQLAIWRSAVTGGRRLFVISGSLGSGKTFRLKLLSAMLPASEHLKVTLDAAAISKLGVEELVAAICREAGAELPVLESPSELGSTGSTWLRDEVCAKLMAALDGARRHRLVWLSIAELDHFDIAEEATSQLLLLLYEQTRAVDWLRIVLDGMRSDIPFSLRDLTARERATEVTLEQIDTWFHRLMNELRIPPDAGIQLATKRAKKSYDQALAGMRPETAMDALVEEVLLLADLLVKQ
jgi:hypothetical protein